MIEYCTRSLRLPCPSVGPMVGVKQTMITLKSRRVSRIIVTGFANKREIESGRSEVEEETLLVPQHVAMIMDGNGRWAKKRLLPRVVGHTRGVKRVRDVVKLCLAHQIRFLTLFAFSTENWQRPEDEVSHLMALFATTLEGELDKLQAHGVRLRVVGDGTRFTPRLQALIASAEKRTVAGERLTLTIAANYGGRWDIQQAFRAWLKNQWSCLAAGGVLPEATEIDLKPYMSMAYAPDPDLVIRTGGEQRISNFLLWQSAYTELYFTDTLWPDFDADAMTQALAWFAGRERRFGHVDSQLRAAAGG